MEKMYRIPPMNCRQALTKCRAKALLSIVSLAFGHVLWTGNVAFAEPSPSALGGYLTIGSATGNYVGDGDQGSWQGNSIGGALQFRLPSGLNLQAGGRISDYSLGQGISPPVWDAGNQNMLSAAAFWRDESIGLIGASIETGEIRAWNDHRFNSIGVFGEIYLKDVSSMGANVTFTDSNTGVNTSISSNDFTYEVWGEYFLSQDMSVRVSAAHQTSKHDFIPDWHENIIGISGEYFIGNLSRTNASLTAGYFRADYADSDRKSNEQFRLGIRWFLGRPDSLREAKRKGAVETRYNNYVDVPRWWQFPL